MIIITSFQPSSKPPLDKTIKPPEKRQNSIDSVDSGSSGVNNTDSSSTEVTVVKSTLSDADKIVGSNKPSAIQNNQKFVVEEAIVDVQSVVETQEAPPSDVVSIC